MANGILEDIQSIHQRYGIGEEEKTTTTRAPRAGAGETEIRRRFIDAVIDRDIAEGIGDQEAATEKYKTIVALAPRAASRLGVEGLRSLYSEAGLDAEDIRQIHKDARLGDAEAPAETTAAPPPPAVAPPPGEEEPPPAGAVERLKGFQPTREQLLLGAAGAAEVGRRAIPAVYRGVKGAVGAGRGRAALLSLAGRAARPAAQAARLGGRAVLGLPLVAGTEAALEAPGLVSKAARTIRGIAGMEGGGVGEEDRIRAAETALSAAGGFLPRLLVPEETRLRATRNLLNLLGLNR